jgi:hypothetical protein
MNVTDFQVEETLPGVAHSFCSFNMVFHGQVQNCCMGFLWGDWRLFTSAALLEVTRPEPLN